MSDWVVDTVKRHRYWFSLLWNVCVCVCFVFVCVCVCVGMTVDHGILFLFGGVPVKGHRVALFFVDLLFYVGWDSRYSEEAPLSVLFVVE